MRALRRGGRRIRKLLRILPGSDSNVIRANYSVYGLGIILHRRDGSGQLS